MKIGIVIVVAAVLALIFWACFFRSGGVAAADPNASQEPTQSEDQSETNEPVQSENPGETKDLYAQLDGAGVGEENAWLGAHVYLCSDGTFSVTVDYGGENVGIETDSGTWTKAGDGSLTLTGTRDFTVEAADNGDGTITYTMEFVNAETSIPCSVTGTASGSADNVYVKLEGAGVGEENSWLAAHVTLLNDGTFTVVIDYGADHAGNETDNGTWTKAGDGSLVLTGTRDFTAQAVDNGDGTITYTMDFVNEETSIPCSVTGTASGSADNVYVKLEGAGVGEENSWLAAHVTLLNDGTFTVVIDYGADHAGNETDNGTWTKAGDGSLVLTGTRDFTAQATDNGDGTVTYTMEFVNAETSIPCSVTGTTSGASQAGNDKVYAELEGAGVGDENAWLTAHVILLNDGTFTVVIDYGADHAGNETDNGTWTKAEDGSLALTGTRDFTVQAADNGAGTITYTMEFVNAETGIPCMVTGTAAG